ncbi:MAG TPA: tripartite tricarboxylate transporter substrate-binding protein, partial [Burkholderiales bacterium]|nr:tripartite tricarboxylate transporter substrate-binding protein [Burkholderiales bacterium]
MNRFLSVLFVGFTFTMVTPCNVGAQAYPSQSIRIIVPFPPGGLVDTLARLLSSELTNAFDQRIVVDNRPGAGGSIGEGEAARSAPDGYTLLMVLDSFA